MPVRWLAIAAGAAVRWSCSTRCASPTARARLTTFLDPWAHAGDEGFQAVQGQIAIGSGGLFGLGLGESVQKNFFLPEAHTDFILAIDRRGARRRRRSAAMLFLYGLVAYAGLRVAKAPAARYAKLLAAGITSLILSQAMLNVFAVLGLAPLTGVPLPFISYGSTNLMVLLSGMGLLLNVRGGRRTCTLRAVQDRPTRRRKGEGDERERRS